MPVENNTPLIGIFGWKTGENSFGASLTYLNYLNGFGDVRILTPDEPIDPVIDLIVVPGGADVDPKRYNAMPHYFTGKPDPIKEYFDTVILPQYIEAGISVLGICRGCQSIAVLFGARLVQHMFHETNDKERFESVHELELEPTTFRDRYRRLRGNDKIKVNSMHHQCVSQVNFPIQTLEVIAMYKGKKAPTIEVIKHRNLPIYGVQYHPEELIKDPLGDFIVEELLQNTKQNYEEENPVENVEELN